MKKIVFMIACVALIFACSTDNTQDPMDNLQEKDHEVITLSSLIGHDINTIDYSNVLPNNAKNGKLKTKKIKLRNSTKIFNPGQPDFRIEGEGNSTLIGKFTLLAEIGPLPNGTFNLIATQTAANGDILRSSFAGEMLDEDTGITTIYWVYFEGTGRFENLEYGELTLTGTITPVYDEDYVAVGDFDGEGFITY